MRRNSISHLQVSSYGSDREMAMDPSTSPSMLMVLISRYPYEVASNPNVNIRAALQQAKDFLHHSDRVEEVRAGAVISGICANPALRFDTVMIAKTIEDIWWRVLNIMSYCGFRSFCRSRKQNPNYPSQEVDDKWVPFSAEALGVTPTNPTDDIPGAAQHLLDVIGRWSKISDREHFTIEVPLTQDVIDYLNFVAGNT